MAVVMEGVLFVFYCNNLF